MRLARPVWLLAALFASSFCSAETAGQSAQSQLLLMIQQLQAEVRQLRGEVETQSYRLERLEREQLERYRDMDRRLSALILNQSDSSLGEETITQPEPQTELTDAQPTSANERAETVAQPAETEAPALAEPVVPQVNDQDAYQAAFQLVRERRFDEALEALDQFINDYPGSDNLANAHYWVGEVLLAQQKLEPALRSFRLVVTEFTEHRKRPDALYKLGVVQERLGDRPGRESTFQQLLDQYPASSAAGLARNFQSR